MIINNGESGRSLIWDAIYLEERSKTKDNSYRIFRFRTEIWTQYIPNTKQKCVQLGHYVR
jgi:hypothetical protein